MATSKQQQRKSVFPFFLQYGVRPAKDNRVQEGLAGAIATVIVFAETDELARARAARHVARLKWEITEVMRAMVIQQHHVEHMDSGLGSIYRRAEQQGIAAAIDGWSRRGEPKTIPDGV